jgi:hypothetical protein
MIASVPGYSGVREWYKYPEQESAPVSLVAGRGYHIFALAREYYGEDHLSIAVQVPSGATCSLPICSCTQRPK